MTYQSGSTFAAGQLMDYVASRGYRSGPVTNSYAAANGEPLRVMGYALLGPRGNRTVVCRYPDDTYSFDAVKLWCDGVDYATKRVLARRRA
jgi:hypothetical protein